MYDIKETFRANSVPEALELLRAHPGAIPVCGGTDVMIHLKERKLRQAALVGIMDIASLQGIYLEQTGDLFIGSGTCFDSIYQNPLARACVPMLADACNQVGSPQIRSIATIGGNLCNGAVSADSVPSLLVLNAELKLTSLEGKRVVKAVDFHTGPGKTVLETARELLTGIRIPKRPMKATAENTSNSVSETPWKLLRSAARSTARCRRMEPSAILPLPLAWPLRVRSAAQKRNR